MLEAQKKGWSVYALEQQDLFVQDNKVCCFAKQIEVFDIEDNYYRQIAALENKPLSDFDFVFMRKDPPVDQNYLYTTYLLEIAQKAGVRIVNNPTALREVNEKLSTLWFPELTPETTVASQKKILKAFLKKHKQVIFKPVDAFGGINIFKVSENEPNLNVILEVLTKNEQQLILAQRFIPEINTSGDKRIFMIDGVPFQYALARFPAPNDIRGNLAAGGKPEACELSPRDKFIASKVGTLLKEKGIFFAGIDVIGDYLTEINVTSPTCVREIEFLKNVNIAEMILDQLVSKN